MATRWHAPVLRYCQDNKASYGQLATRWHAPVLRYYQDNKASYGHQVACSSPLLLLG